MDIFCCVAQGLIPYGNQVLLIGGLVGGAVAPVQIIPHMYYIFLLAISSIVSIFIPFADGTLRKDPWNWEHNCAESNVGKQAK